MKKMKITSFQWMIMTFFLLNTFIPLIGYHTLTKINQTTALISILIGYFLITIFIFLIKPIFHYQKTKNILEKIELLFPTMKYIFYLVLIIIISIALLYSLNTMVTFINYYVLKDISLIVISISLLLTILYVLTKSMDSIFRLGEICFYIYFLILIISLIGVFKYIDLYNVKPLLSSPIKDTMISSLLYFSSCLIPLFILGIIPLTNISKNKKVDRSFFNAAKISALVIFINLFTIITSLGIELTNIYQNPDMILYKKISFLNLLDRVESTISFNNILNSFFFILLGIYFLKEVFKKLFQLKKEKVTLSLSLIILALIMVSSILIIPQSIYLIASAGILLITIILNVRIFIDKYIQKKQELS